MSCVAVIDVGKTNAKLALVDATSLREIEVETRPNLVLPGPPWPHFDLEGHWVFFLDALTRMSARHDIIGLSITTHGASAVLLDHGGAVAAPMLDYEHDGPDDLAAEYDAIRPAFADTGSPRLPSGLNLGAQLHWQFCVDHSLRDRTAHILTYPQYWAWRLTGQMATEVTSLGCHTDLWYPREGTFSSLVETLGIAGKLPPARTSDTRIGTVSIEIAARTGLSPDTPVACGIHDSNASLYPHIAARDGAFSVVSTGTWVISMAVNGARTALDPARDTLINVSAKGAPVPSARFMGGREYDLIRGGIDATPTRADRDAVLDGIMLLPAVESGSGPFPGRDHSWTSSPPSGGARLLALSYYLALMTDTCLTLVGASGPVIVEGPFARNPDYLELLGAIRPDGILTSDNSTGTSIGSACLMLDDAPYDPPEPVPSSKRATTLRAYADGWRVKSQE